MTPFRSSLIVVGALLSLACSGEPQESLIFGSGPGSPGSGKGSGSDKGGSSGQPVLINIGGSLSSGGSSNGGGGDCGPNLTGLVRDFKAAGEPGGHPDFETFSGGDASLGIVQAMLGPDKKPVYAPTGPLVDPTHGQQTTDKARFDQWYRDTEGVNQSLEFLVPLRAGAGGIASYDNDAFFPVDGKLFGQFKDSGHNFHFTFELHTEFIYKGGEVFTFIGDDDLWVFVNGHLGIDLGGLHPERTRTISLDMVAGRFGLQVGSTYPLDLFHAERHTTASHFRIDTSIQFTNCEPIIIPK